MDDLPLPQVADGIAHVRVLHHPQDVVVGAPGLLFGTQVLRQVGDHIPLGLEFAGVEGDAPGGLGPDAGGVVNVVGAEAALLDLLGGEIAGQLVDDGRHDLHVGQLLRADVRQHGLALVVGHGVALGEVAHGRANFPVGAAVLAHDKLGHLRVWIFDFHRILQSLLIHPHQSIPPSQGQGPFTQVQSVVDRS